MFLSKPKKAGDEILREKAQIQVTEQDYKDYNTMLRRINEQLILFSRDDEDLFKKLHMKPAADFYETVNRFVTNAVPVHGVRRLFLKTRSFNHSCAPNAKVGWDTEFLRVKKSQSTTSHLI